MSLKLELLKSMEVINYLLGFKDYYIVQNTQMFNFSLDSVLLPNFVTINKNVSKLGFGLIPISRKGFL